MDEGERLEFELDMLIGTTVVSRGLVSSQIATPKSCWNDKAGTAAVDKVALGAPELSDEWILLKALRKKDMAG
jgi:hypothetical protein